MDGSGQNGNGADNGQRGNRNGGFHGQTQGVAFTCAGYHTFYQQYGHLVSMQAVREEGAMISEAVVLEQHTNNLISRPVMVISSKCQHSIGIWGWIRMGMVMCNEVPHSIIQVLEHMVSGLCRALMGRHNHLVVK
jgi:hypothetical protein